MRCTTHANVTNLLEHFSYAKAGNRLADAYRVYSYNELNQLVEDDSATYAYDLDGNMVLKVDKASGDTTKYDWDIENRLVRVTKPGTVAEYVYDALGRRVAKTVKGVRTEFRYDGEDLILTMNDAGAVTGSWTFGPGIDQPLAMNRAGVMHYYLADGLGSVRALVDSAGAVDQTYEYSVFGEITKQTGTVDNPFTYTAREWEPEVGLCYYRARRYDARVGRFVSEDPIAFVTRDYNPYLYVSNDPALYSDPFGLEKNPVYSALGVYYGNWGGPKHSGPDYPIDDMDQCFRSHDVCYLDFSITNYRCGDPNENKNRCDQDLVSCLDRIGSDPTKWNRPAPDIEEAQDYWQKARNYFQGCLNNALLEGYNPP